MVGYDPDEEHKRAREGESQHVGKFDGWQLRLIVRPGRVDWFLDADNREAVENPESLLLSGGPFDTALEPLSKLADKWLGMRPAVSRLAFGVILIQPVNDPRFGYMKISEYLPNVQIDPDNSSDFFYQINRPRDSAKIPGLRINRLTKWSVITTGTANINLALQGKTKARVISDHESHFCRAELDINTAADFQGELRSSELVTIFEELIDLSKEIAEEGDIP